MVRAIETTGTVDEARRLVLDERLPLETRGRVRVIILLEEEGDIGEQEWLHAAVSNPSFEFLKDTEEDIYTVADGEPFGDQG